MGRRSILEEGEQKASNESEESNETNKSENKEKEDSEGNSKSERIQTTLRLPSELYDDLDEWANKRGMSNNAAATYFIAEGLND